MLSQMNRSGRFGAKGDTVNTTHKIKAATATLTVGFLLTIAFAATAQAANDTTNLMTQRAEAMNRHYQLGAFSPERLRSQAMNRFYHVGASSTTGVQQAEKLRSEGMNLVYHLGAYSSTGAAAQRAVERRDQAINRVYHLGNYAVAGTSSTFDWNNVGIGAGGVVGLIILAGGMAVVVRRRQPSSPSTT
jgi:hypothetical protein